jgi:hypothetical protein
VGQSSVLLHRPETDPADVTGGSRVRCPKCGWEPRADDVWTCDCGHLWNTFETRGVCPACAHAWRDTQCPRCHEWSPHDDWYVEDGARP